MIKEKVDFIIKKTISRHQLIEKGDTVIVGLSGGPDSGCLFSFLVDNARELGISLHAVHVNHQLRPVAAEADEAYVKTLCEKFDVSCHSFTVDCNERAKEEGLSSEEAGRLYRYEAFGQVAESLISGNPDSGPVKIALGHNKNDQAETLLFRLLRGTGPDGLAGMEYMRSAETGAQAIGSVFDIHPVFIIRPILDVGRNDIEEYCRAKGLEPREDLTNKEPLYSRNKIRLGLIPYLEKEFNGNIIEGLCRLAEIAGQDRAFLQGEAEAALKSLTVESIHHRFPDCNKQSELSDALPHFHHEKHLDLNRLLELPISVRNRVILLAFKEIGLIQDINQVHLEAANELIKKGRTGSRIDFPGGYSLKISYGLVIVASPEFQVSSNKPELHQAQSHRQEAAQPSDPELCWRTRQPGDYIRLKNDGRKKIQDLFVDKKIPREERDKILLFCKGHEVIEIDYDPSLPD